jgi:hypothetical protein
LQKRARQYGLFGRHYVPMRKQQLGSIPSTARRCLREAPRVMLWLGHVNRVVVGDFVAAAVGFELLGLRRQGDFVFLVGSLHVGG